jgi:probable DNA repair protein
MGSVELLPVEIVEALERGATVVTGNQRAARTLRHGFDRRNRTLGLASWRPAAVIAWDSWTAGLWRELVVEGKAAELLLNRTQEHAVWRSILEADGELGSLRTPDALAEMAAEAWARLCSYNGQGRIRGAAGSSDARAFQRWAVEFQRRCRDEKLLAPAQLEEALQRMVNASQVAFGAAGIVLVGFDAMTPAQMGLVEALREVGVAVDELRLNVPVERRGVVTAADERDELFAAARWVRNFLEERPAARVAVVVPGLEKHKAGIDRVFREVLAPELESIAAPTDVGPYEFSVGVMLEETPMVRVALDLLRWTVEPLPLERISGLLLSPQFALTKEEIGARAEFDAFELRKTKMLRPEITLDGLIAAMEHSKRKARLGGLLSRLRAVRYVVTKRFAGGDRQSYAAWADGIGELLEAAGWGGGSSEDSIAFQTRRKWDGALDELSTLDFDGGWVPFGRALEQLKRIARQTMFAPESRETPVQVMGPLEAAGGSFDALWFLRAGDLSWPMVMGGSPLLPWQIQRELRMSGVDMVRDSELARQVTERITESAETVIFSYAVESAEGKQRPSAALGSLGLEEIEAEELGVAARSERTPVELEAFEDSAPIQAPPDHPIHGGASILQAQAACGFRAFAAWRLWSTEIESVELGMDARESGIVLHKVLELFWNKVKHQNTLKTMPHIKRADVLGQCIEEALRRKAEQSATTWDAAYVDVQRERLRRLIELWLEKELERAPFEVKLSERKLDDVRIGPLRLNIRVDRVDATDDGEVIIDYKTSNAVPGQWMTERPDAPQLPLYAVLSEAEKLNGVAFGVLRAGKDMGWKGYASAGTLPKPAKMDLPLAMQVEEWRRVLEALAMAFYSGDARVEPKSYPTTCRHCAQRVLCRLDVSQLEVDEDEDEIAAAEVSRG